MIVEVPISCEHFVVLILSIMVAFFAGAMIPWLGASMKFESILEYIRMDEDDAWYHRADYEKVESERDTLKNDLTITKLSNEDLHRKCEALNTQIECLKAENCKLKTNKEEL